jgi:DNA-binding response OmpR family regulator
MEVATHQRQGYPQALVVEDEEGLKKNLVGGMLRLEGYYVATVGYGLQGLLLHLSFRPEPVITNAVISIMDGVELVFSLRGRVTPASGLCLSAAFRYPLPAPSSWRRSPASASPC